MANVAAFQSPKASYPRLISQSQVEETRKQIFGLNIPHENKQLLWHEFLQSANIEHVNEEWWSKMYAANLVERLRELKKIAARPYPSMLLYFEMVAACEQAGKPHGKTRNVVPLSAGDLARLMGVTVGNLRPMVKDLETVGLVEREYLDKGRGVNYHLNPLVAAWGDRDELTDQVVNFRELKAQKEAARHAQLELV